MSSTCGTGRLELDEKEADEEDRVLPDDLGDVLLSGTYRNYLAANGEIREGREQDYKVKQKLCVELQTDNLKLVHAD